MQPGAIEVPVGTTTAQRQIAASRIDDLIVLDNVFEASSNSNTSYPSGACTQVIEELVC